jgi:membrane protein
MQEHYNEVGASQQAGAATYFAFLSFFPVLALSFFAVGWIARVYPGAKDNLRTAIDNVLPGLLGQGDGQISMLQVQDAAGALGIFGLLGVLYAGLGWLSSLQTALLIVFETPARERPNFIVAKVRDLATLVVLGAVLLVAVAVTGFIRSFSGNVLDWLHLGSQLGWLLTVVTVVLGLAANALLFYAMFVLLARPQLQQRSLWQGAILGGVAFEVLKQLSGLLLGATRGQPAFQAFGISLILVVWINYFSRVTLYAASYAITSEPSPVEDAPPVQGPSSPPVGERISPAVRESVERPIAFVAGVVAGAAGLALAVRRRRPR